ncbi:MAG TPA: HDOD domain-containing protein [Paenalcaligenes hominis]|uniref:EAL and modified HD-GYP domain-containing signal transduction protein n=1 Tax=Paenalcaligenes hominis TaxID=643674 RepID=A0A9D3AAS6_9BURK|nr:HDOD domain-containing protein [Paenalcaligenes hominis]NJB65766.1 EAL and modified HD-GYP domain-containing signal transduction protein [Paenalcaligenes hominis]GGE69514.1 histidine kinase [Paenalcaligenes hominis]HJH23991.1 HDOD domain-containing protein [Paenalcaligenes hominis]
MSNSYCIALQPICDRHLNHIGDELLYRSNAKDKSAKFSDAMVATARASNIAFYEIGLEQLVGKRMVFLNAPKEWLLKPELLPPRPRQIVIEVLETVIAEPEVLEALEVIKNKGYLIALDDFVLNEKTDLLLNYADIVKIDTWQTVSTEDLAYYKARKLKLLAEKVETKEDFEFLVQMGFDYFQGYFYAKPLVHPESVHERVSNRHAQLRLLAELQHENVDYAYIEELILLDPQLTYIILKHANSAYYALHNKTTSVAHAIQTLGLRRLRAIVATQIFTSSAAGSHLLLPQVLTRAAMCEHMAELHGIDTHTAFVVGLLSKIHVIFDVPYGELLHHLSLPFEIIQQLELRQGKYGRLLGMIESFEQGNMNQLSPEEVAILNQIWFESRVWVQDILEHITEQKQADK